MIAFAMLILQVYMLLFENRKFTAVAKNSLEKSECHKMLNFFEIACYVPQQWHPSQVYA